MSLSTTCTPPHMHRLRTPRLILRTTLRTPLRMHGDTAYVYGPEPGREHGYVRKEI